MPLPPCLPLISFATLKGIPDKIQCSYSCKNVDTGLLSLSGVYFSYLTTLLTTLHLLTCLFEPGAQEALRMFLNSLCNKHWPWSPDPPASASPCWGYVYTFYIYYFLDSLFFDKVHEWLIYTIFTERSI